MLTPRFARRTRKSRTCPTPAISRACIIMNLETGQRETRRRFSRHDFRAAILARRAARRHEPAGAGWRLRHLRDGSAQSRQKRQLSRRSNGIDTSPSYSPDGRSDRIRKRPRQRQAAAMCMSSDGSNQHPISARATAATRRRSGRRAATTSRSPSRLGGQFIIGVMKPGRLGRARPDRRLPQRGPDLGPQRPGSDVLPGVAGRQRRPANLFGRYHRLQRAQGADAGLRLRSRMVAASQLRCGRVRRMRANSRHAVVASRCRSRAFFRRYFMCFDEGKSVGPSDRSARESQWHFRTYRLGKLRDNCLCS